MNWRYKLLLKSFSKTEPYEACNLPRAFKTSTFEARLKETESESFINIAF